MMPRLNNQVQNIIILQIYPFAFFFKNQHKSNPFFFLIQKFIVEPSNTYPDAGLTYLT